MSIARFLAAALLLATPAAFAADNPNGFYLGAGLGKFDVSDLTGTVEDYSADDDTLKLFGGYPINPYFALEIGYIDLGEASTAPRTSCTASGSG